MAHFANNVALLHTHRFLSLSPIQETAHSLQQLCTLDGTFIILKVQAQRARYSFWSLSTVEVDTSFIV